MGTPYFVYMLRCADGTLYTGITTDVERRFSEHQNKTKGAKYTASHTPLGVERVWKLANRSEASRLEYRIKKLLNRAQKESLITDPAQLPSLVEMQAELIL